MLMPVKHSAVIGITDDQVKDAAGVRHFENGSHSNYREEYQPDKAT